MNEEEIKDYIKNTKCPNCNSINIGIVPIFAGEKGGFISIPNHILDFTVCFDCGTMFNDPGSIKKYLERLKNSKRYKKYVIE